MEEAPESYKNVTDVVDTCHSVGISNKAIKLRPIGVIKGWLITRQEISRPYWPFSSHPAWIYKLNLLITYNLLKKLSLAYLLPFFHEWFPFKIMNYFDKKNIVNCDISSFTRVIVFPFTYNVVFFFIEK